MKAQTYHPFTVGRQARKGGGESVPSGLVQQVAQNTQDIAELDSKIDGLIKQAVVQVTDATFVYNNPSQEPGLHSRGVMVSNCRPLKVFFNGFYKMVEGVEQSVWSPITFKAPGGSMIGEINHTPEGFEVPTNGDGDLSPVMESKLPITVIGKETYNDDYTTFRVSAIENYNSFQNYYYAYLEVVLDTTISGPGSTEQDIQSLYTWEEGVYAKFTILYI